MNDSITVTPSLISPGSGFAPAGSGLLAGEAGLAGLNGAFSQLLALSMPVADGGAVNGQPLPTVGTALPLGSPEAGSQLAAFLDDFAGDTIPEEMLAQLREQGISRQQLADVVHLLERSDIARMPAIAEMVSQLKAVMKEIEGQQSAVEGEALTLIATPDEGEGIDALDESDEGSARTEVTDSALSDVDEAGVGLSDRQVVESSAVQAQATQAQPQVQAETQAQVQAEARAQAQVQTPTPTQVQTQTQAQAQTQTQVPTQPQTQTQVQTQPQTQTQVQTQPQTQTQVQTQPQTQTLPQTQVSTQPQPQTQVQTQTQAQAQAQESVSRGENRPAPQVAELRTLSADKAQSTVSGEGSKSVAGQGVGELKERPVGVTTPQTPPVDHAAKIKNTAMADLMKSQQAAASAATGTLLSDAEQLMSRLTAAAQQARPGVSAGVLQGMAVADSQARQVELSRPVSIPGIHPMPKPVASTAGAVPVAQPSVEPVDAGLSSLVSSQLKKASAEPASARRNEPVQLSGPEVRAGADVAVKAPPSVSVSPTNLFASAGSDGSLPAEQAGADKGGDEGRVREGSERVVMAAARQSGEQAMQAHQLVMSGRPPMASPAWSGTLNNHVMWLATQNNKVAEIQLDPPELGSLQVKIRVSQDQVSVSFVSPHASVRDAVEQSMARLRDMFEEQGLDLAESSVEDQSAQQHGGRDGMEGSEADEGYVQGDDGDAESVAGSAQAHAVSLVDYYA